MSPFYQRYLGFFKLGLLLEDDITEGSYPFFTNLFSVHLINNFFATVMLKHMLNYGLIQLKK